MLPALTPLLVVDNKDVDALVRSARADLAKLALELRALQHEAASVRSVSEANEAAPAIDLDDARELLRTGVEARLARRRVERRAEIDQTHCEAEQRLADAEAEATALVDAARAEFLRAIGKTTSPPSPAVRRFARSAAAMSTFAPDDDPSPSSLWTPAVSERAWNVATEVLPPVPAPPPPDDDADWRLVTEVAPPASPPRPAALSTPSAVAEAAPIDPAPPSEPARPAGWPIRSRWLTTWQGLLHADVLLPLIAVAIVALVLAAWVA